MPKSQITYQPDDGPITLDALRFLRSGAGTALRDAVGAMPPSIAQMEQLRKDYPRSAVDAALTMAAIQDKAALKFGPSSAGWIWAVPEALQQASSLAVARHKATRFAAAQAESSREPVLDLCAGIGGDSLGLASKQNVLAMEMSEVRAFCAAANAEDIPTAYSVRVLCADVRELPLGSTRCAASFFHIDPARRSSGQRTHHYDESIPGPETMAKLINSFAGGAIKLSSAVDFDDLPPGHIEIISEQGTVVQAVLWVKRAQQALGSSDRRTATIIRRAAAAFSFTAAPGFPLPPVAPQNYLFEVDAGVHRAGLAAPLAATLHLESLNADGGYLTGDLPIEHPALAAFTHVATLPFDEKHLVAALRGIPGSGPVEIKTRGKIGLDTDALQRRLTLAAPCGTTVLIYRVGTHGGKIRASIAKRISVPAILIK